MASRGINKVILIGSLGQNPEVSTFQGEELQASLSVTTTEIWKDLNIEEMRLRSECHRVSVFGPSANCVANYAKNGSLVYFEVQLPTREWQEQNARDRYTTEVVVRRPSANIQLLSGLPDSNAVNFESSQEQPTTNSVAPLRQSIPNNPLFSTTQQINWDDFDDDILVLAVDSLMRPNKVSM
ncbi:single-stranded DNA-binding protein [Shewanella marisflavi]|uniref:Single-stranded DNA-binding protein n=2 Tax=Shewanellaceae TaxID=267890 RepID=A0ABX5WVQ3_9GAMM|nr:single-stranded DNA-binding protein [Shewanella marisflavi]